MKNKSTLFWVLGGAAAAAASIYAAKRIQVYLAWREEQELEETNRQIEQYEDYVHSNGGSPRKRSAHRKSEVTS